jgi:uncharacterized protein (DUF2147 family)
MFKKIAFSCLFVLIVQFTYAQKSDDILGKWLTATGEGQIEIYKKGNKYFGKLVWINDPNDEKGKLKTYLLNPNPSLRNKPVMGMELLKDFVYEDKRWTDGTIYDPNSGKTYSCNLNLKNFQQLTVRGYIGISLLGRSEVWRRVK